MPDMNCEKLIFVESAAQAARASELCKEDAGLRILALTPHAVYELEKLERRFITPEEIYPDNLLMDHCAERYPEIDRACALMDNAAGAALGSPDALARMNYFAVKRLIDSVHSRMVVTSKIIEALRPHEILYFPTLSEPMSEELCFENESIYSRLLERVFRASVKCTAAAGAPDVCRGGPGTGAFRPAVRRFIKTCQNTLSDAASRISGKRIVYDCIAGKDASLLIDSLKSRFGVVYPCYFTPCGTDASTVNGLNNAWNSLDADAAFTGLFNYDGVSYFSVIRERLKHLVSVVFPETARWHYLFTRKLRKGRVAFAMTSNLDTHISKALLEACKEQGVPFIEYQHGALGFFEFPINYYNNLRYGDYYFCYGEGFKEHYSKYPVDGARIRVVGSAALDALRSRNAKGVPARPGRSKPVFYFTPTNLNEQQRYFSYHTVSDNIYYSLQKEIVDLFAGLADKAELVVKMHPSANWGKRMSPIVKYIADRKLPSVRVITQGNLTDHIHEADAFVFDSPTTVLLQAIAAEKPVYILNKTLRFTGKALEQLSKRAFIADSTAELRGRILETPGRKPDDSFFRSFGTSGHSLERAKDEIKRLVA